jgi:hypothetical protein
VKYVPFETGKLTSVINTAVQSLTATIPLGPGSKSHIPTGYVVFFSQFAQDNSRTESMNGQQWSLSTFSRNSKSSYPVN